MKNHGSLCRAGLAKLISRKKAERKGGFVC